MTTNLFEAFTEYAYTGDYFVPAMVLVKERYEPDDDPSQVCDEGPAADDWDFQSFGKKKRRPVESPKSCAFRVQIHLRCGTTIEI